MPLGKGFADIAFLPRKGVNRPAMLFELKWGKSPKEAASQIMERGYAHNLAEKYGNVVMPELATTSSQKNAHAKLRSLKFSKPLLPARHNSSSILCKICMNLDKSAIFCGGYSWEIQTGHAFF
jgi:hypothetical protein